MGHRAGHRKGGRVVVSCQSDNDQWRTLSHRFPILRCGRSGFCVSSIRRRNAADGDLRSAWRTPWSEKRDRGIRLQETAQAWPISHSRHRRLGRIALRSVSGQTTRYHFQSLHSAILFRLRCGCSHKFTYGCAQCFGSVRL
jgi:hypothetical protein